jgi:triacylglycerol lipase
MDFDNSWDALLKPGDATVYFDNLSLEKFQVDATSYSPINAWWLAELCRLIYRQGADEVDPPPKGPTRQEILKEVGLEQVEFFNASDTQGSVIKTSESANARFAVLVFRGTNALRDWLTNLNGTPVSWPGGGVVHEGFRNALDLVWDDVSKCLDSVECPIYYTGHSLGAALAALAASRRTPRALYTFGSPLTGDKEFASTLSGTGVYRVVNNRDAVTTVPPHGFDHLGELHYITHDGGMLVNPDDDTVARDRLKRDCIPIFSRDWLRHFTDAPEPLADHAPVNYVAHLERLFSAES